jgi:hypothetical protein
MEDADGATHFADCGSVTLSKGKVHESSMDDDPDLAVDVVTESATPNSVIASSPQRTAVVDENDVDRDEEQ